MNRSADTILEELVAIPERRTKKAAHRRPDSWKNLRTGALAAARHAKVRRQQHDREMGR